MGASESKPSIKYELVDILDTVAGQDEESILVMNEDTGESMRWHRKMWGYLFTEQKIFIFIILSIVGSLSACSAFLIDITISELYNVIEASLITFGPFFLDYFIYILYSILFCFLSAATVILVSPYSTGSGIPEMKSILSGVHIPNYLSVSTLIAKVMGLICAFAGGLSIGKEGPYVHISSIIAQHVMRFPLWRKLAKHESLRFQVISAACAVGVSTSFGSPVGGVLFSVEVTSNYYMVENLWKGFWCSMCGALVIRLLAEFGFQVGLISLFRLNDNAFTTVELYDWQELIIFACVGITGGLIGAAFVRTTKWLIAATSSIKFFQKLNATLVRACTIGLIVALLTYPFPLIRNDQMGIDYIFDSSQKQLEAIPFLFGMVVIKFVITAISQLAGLACGVYTPLFVLGAAYGRFIGEVIALIVPNEISPLSYAVVGAAAVCASATHTISTAVIVVELTGQFHLLLPILISVLLADGIGKLLSRSIYDELLFQKGLPYMPSFVVGSVMQNLKAKDIMQPEETVTYLTLNSTYGEAKEFTKAGRFCNYNFPLVENSDNMMLLGTVKRSELVKLLRSAKKQEKLVTEETRRAEEAHYNKESEIIIPDDIDLEDPPILTERKPVRDMGITNRQDQIDIWKQRLPFLFTDNAVDSCFDDMVIVDPSPFQISEQIKISKIHFIFTMLGIRDVCVTHRGRFVGIITKNNLLSYLQN